MRVLVVGYGVQGKKRLKVAGSDGIGVVDPIAPEATWRDLHEVPAHFANYQERTYDPTEPDQNEIPSEDPPTFLPLPQLCDVAPLGFRELHRFTLVSGV